MKEEWLPLSSCATYKEFPGYDVSNLGRMRSWKPYRNYAPVPENPRIMRFRINKDGYFGTRIYDRNGRCRNVRVHRLVLHIFKGPPPNTKQKGLHFDGDRLNNKITNLYWGTAKENTYDSIRHGTWVHGIRVNTAKLDEEKVRYVKGSTKSHTALARELGVTVGAIWQIRDGRTWKHVKC